MWIHIPDWLAITLASLFVVTQILSIISKSLDKKLEELRGKREGRE